MSGLNSMPPTDGRRDGRLGEPLLDLRLEHAVHERGAEVAIRSALDEHLAVHARERALLREAHVDRRALHLVRIDVLGIFRPAHHAFALRDLQRRIVGVVQLQHVGLSCASFGHA
jgi:hypothetical protein